MNQIAKAEHSIIATQLDKARHALAQATDDFQRVEIRDHAKAVAEAAEVLKRKDIQVQAANLVQDAERAIAKANPPKQRGGDRRSDKFQTPPKGEFENKSPINQKATQNIRRAHTKVTDEQFEQLKQEAINNQEPLTRKAVMERGKQIANPGYRNTGEVEWYTPLEIIDRVRLAFNGTIDIDPASCQEANNHIKANHFFDISDNGLEQAWNGTVFVNPPFSQLQDFTDKFISERQNGNMTAGCFLADSHTQPNWFIDLWSFCDVHFIYTERSGRFEYWNENKNLNGKARGYVFYTGNNISVFINAFKDIGKIGMEVTSC